MTNSEHGPKTEDEAMSINDQRLRAVERGEVLGVLTGQVPVSGPFGARLPKQELDGEFIEDEPDDSV